jgi:hypothetical protein
MIEKTPPIQDSNSTPVAAECGTSMELLATRGTFLELPPELLANTGRSPLQTLYESSCQSDHFEGAAVSIGLQEILKASALRHDFPLLTYDAFSYRIEILYASALKLFRHCPEVCGVVFFGSAMLGKEIPSDIDCYAVYDRRQGDISDNELRTFGGRAVSEGRIDAHLDGVPLSIALVSAYDQHHIARLRFAERGPFLAIAPLPDELHARLESVVPLQVFLNSGGTAYLKHYYKYQDERVSECDS